LPVKCRKCGEPLRVPYRRTVPPPLPVAPASKQTVIRRRVWPIIAAAFALAACIVATVVVIMVVRGRQPTAQVAKSESRERDGAGLRQTEPVVVVAKDVIDLPERYVGRRVRINDVRVVG